MTSIMSHNIPFIPFPLPLNFNLLSQTADFNGVLNRNNYFDKRMEEDDDYKSTSTSTSTKSDERMRNSGGGLHGDEDDEDKQSVCSELSVGKEMGDVNCGESSGMKIDVERRLSVSPIMKSKYASTEWSESERGSVATHEETSCDSSRPYSADPQVPVVIRPTPARLQEEFLKSSQVYAEELMRQRIRILAATRSVKPLEQTFGGFLPRLENVIASRSLESEKSPKVGFRPPSADATNFQPQYNPKLPVNVNFHNIHSHLNAISQITQNLNADSHKKSTSSSPAASNLSFRDNSQSPPSGTGNYYNQHHHHSHLSPMNGDANLKFSIDNILKSDFGQQRSGITDPLKRTKTVSRKTQQRQESRQQRQQQANAGKLLDPPTPVATTSKSEPPSDPASVPTKQLPLPNAMKAGEKDESMVWPAWVYCTRYSDRPSSGPRVKKPKKAPEDKASADDKDDKRPRTAFNGSQLARLKREFNENRYLTEKRRLALSAELGLNEAQIKIWFQNKRAKIKKSTGQKNPLALQLMAQGLYNHSTIPLTQEEEELQELQAAGKV